MMRILLTLLLVSCTKPEKADYANYKFLREINLVSAHTKPIPSKFREQLDQDYFSLSQRPIERTETQKQVLLNSLSREYLPVSFFLVDYGNVVSEKSILFKSEGGGEIDLSAYVSNLKGRFVAGFILDTKFSKENTKVYFLTDIKSANCSKIKNITNEFFDKVLAAGIETTTENYTYAKLLQGAFYFVANIEDKYYTAQIYIGDSRLQKFKCR